MKRSACIVVLVLAGCGSAATSSQPGNLQASSGPRPPVAAQRAYQIKSPSGDRNDPYYWLRDDTRKSPDVLGYLNAENAYAKAILDPAKPLENKLLAEMKSHIQEDDASAPVLDDGYWYYTRFTAGQEQAVVESFSRALRTGVTRISDQVVLQLSEQAPQVAR